MIFKNVAVICEGQTEVDFVKKLNKKYFNAKNISLKPITVNKANAMNGSVSLERIRYFINSTNENIVTTFIDYYGFKGNNNKSFTELEKEIEALSDKKQVIAYVQLHETEALWFANIDIIKKVKNANKNQQDALDMIVTQYPNPEDINNSKETAPSKRLEKIFKDYRKISDGNAISEKISIEEIRKKCPHFSDWLFRIENTVNCFR